MVAALTAEGGRLGRLLTTRNDELAGEHAQKVVALEEGEALRVLASYMGRAATAEGLPTAPVLRGSPPRTPRRRWLLSSWGSEYNHLR